MRSLPDKRMRAVIKDVIVYRTRVATAFLVVNFAVMLIGFGWPREYISATTLLFQKNEASSTVDGTVSHAPGLTETNPRSLFLGQEQMPKILARAGWLANRPGTAEQERVIKVVQQHASVRSIRPDLFEIEYRDEDPERAVRTAKAIANVFIVDHTMQQNKETGSQDLDRQLQVYRDRLQALEQQLQAQGADVGDLQKPSGSSAAHVQRIHELEHRVAQTKIDLKDARDAAVTLEHQLAAELRAAIVASREAPYRARLQELETQLATLRVDYKDNYPDIVQVKRDLEELRVAMKRARTDEGSAEAKKLTERDIAAFNPRYARVTQDLTRAKAQIETLSVRIFQDRHRLEQEHAALLQAQTDDARLAALKDEYVMDRQIVDILTERREQQASRQADVVQYPVMISQPNSVRIRTEGPPLLAFIVAGIIAGLLLPFIFIYVRQLADRKIRISAVFSERLKLPVLAHIPHFWTSPERRAWRTDNRWSMALLSANAFVSTFVLTAHMKGII